MLVRKATPEERQKLLLGLAAMTDHHDKRHRYAVAVPGGT